MFGAFLLASLALALTPGPAVIYLLTRTLAHGRRAGFASLAGVALGNLGNAVGASLGLAALFAVSALAFTVVKLAGAAYLVYLGIQALRSRPVGTVGVIAAPPSARAVFRDGFLVALLNPKTALFFAAFLPQFIDASSAPLLQGVLLASVFILVAALTDAIYVLAASRLAGWHAAGAAPLPGHRLLERAGRYLGASVFIGLGVYTALSEPRAR
ncbi:MAG: LysE family translocator [Burkholderiaceae bacterium]|nr:LysE family translocator [Burkholderiaceae bacterium]